jgi:penicillin-binding protein-related factor A (putative recombinase)
MNDNNTVSFNLIYFCDNNRVYVLKYHRARGVTSVSHGEAFQYIASDSEHIDCIHVCMSI